MEGDRDLHPVRRRVAVQPVGNEKTADPAHVGQRADPAAGGMVAS